MSRINYSQTSIARKGRDGDKFMAHIAPGEMIVPPVISPELRARLHGEMIAAGIPPEQYTVGGGMSINPETGLPEFGFGKFLKKVAHVITQPIASVANAIPGGNIIVPAALSLINPALGAAYVGTRAYGEGASIGSALGQGALSYAGGQIGSSIGNSIGSGLGTVGSAASKIGLNLGQSVSGSGIGASIGNALGRIAPQATTALAGQGIGSLLGSSIGSNIGSSLAAGKPAAPTATAPLSTTPAFTPTQEAAQQLPASLNSLGSLTGDQQLSDLATQGVYGSGNGPDEQSYFLNLVNRQLVDQGGNTQATSTLQPIEQSYLQNLGISSSGDSSSILEAINRWRQNQAPQAA